MSAFSLIIPAAGKGTRMASPTPKQLLPLGKYPILAYTLFRFLSVPNLKDIIIPTAPDIADAIAKAAGELPFHHPPRIISGGDRRQDSVAAALVELQDTDTPFIAIHDAVRPFFHPEYLSRAFETLENQPEIHGVVAGIPAIHTMKWMRSPTMIEKTIDRARLIQTHTPQIFRKNPLIEAFRHFPDTQMMTDESQAMENQGYSVMMETDTPENIKITMPADRRLAEYLLRQNPWRELFKPMDAVYGLPHRTRV